MFYVRSLERWSDEVIEFEQRNDAETDAENKSWADEAIGVYEGDDFESSELVAIAFESTIFWR